MNPASWKSRQKAICTALAVAIGLAIGWLDLHTTEVIVTILALLLAGLLLGLVQPTAAWRWAVLLALGLPAMAVVGNLLRVRTADPFGSAHCPGSFGVRVGRLLAALWLAGL